MKTDLLTNRHNGIQEADLPVMLEKIGVGSVVFHCEEAACVFAGDVLFYGSIGRADLKGGNFDELREGICSHLFTLPEETRVYPGHGPSTSIGYEKKNNPFFR